MLALLRQDYCVIARVKDCIHVEAMLSINEMWACLPQILREPGSIRQADLLARIVFSIHVGTAFIPGINTFGL
jgi:hypothetical protein